MKRDKPNIDYKKHISYSKTAALDYNVCDAFFVDTESELLEKYPVRTGENGYITTSFRAEVT